MASLILLCTTTVGAMQHYRPLVYKNPEYKKMVAADLDRWPGVQVFQLKSNANMKMVWDLGRVIADWDDQMIAGLLASGQPVAVVSDGPVDQVFGKELLVKVVGTYDYKKGRPSKRKIYLSVLTGSHSRSQ